MTRAGKRHAELRKDMRRVQGFAVRAIACASYSGGFLCGLVTVAAGIPPPYIPLIMLVCYGVLVGLTRPRV